MTIEHNNFIYNIKKAARFDLAMPKHVAVLIFYEKLLFSIVICLYLSLYWDSSLQPSLYCS